MTDTLSAAIAAIYSVGEILRCDRVDRTASDLVRIELADGACWLKLPRRTGRTIAELEAEAEIVGCLADAGIGVAAPVRRVDGRYAGPVELLDGVCLGVMFREAPGVEVTTPTLAQARALGVSIATVHLASACMRTDRWTIDAASLYLQPLASLEREVPLLPELVEIREIGAEMIARVWGEAENALPIGLCHGDLHLDNVRFDGATPTLFDFEACGTGPLVYDLACYWRKRVGLGATPTAPAVIGEWDALLAGYQSVRSLTSEEHRAIPALATLRAIWTMAMPASPLVSWGRDWLDSEYFAAHASMIRALADAGQQWDAARHNSGMP